MVAWRSAGAASRGGAAAPHAGPTEQKREGQAWERIRERIIAQFVPTGLVLNENREIVHSFGEPQRFLTLPPGRATLDAVPARAARAGAGARHGGRAGRKRSNGRSRIA